MVLDFALGQEDGKSLPYCRYERQQQHWMPRLVPDSVDMVKGNTKCHSECGLIVQMNSGGSRLGGCDKRRFQALQRMLFSGTRLGGCDKRRVQSPC
jgi:hypothetical protein